LYASKVQNILKMTECYVSH